MKKFSTLAGVIFFFIVFAPSCSKKGGNPACPIVTVTLGGSDVYNLNYNGSGQLTSMLLTLSGGSEYESFVYSGNKVTVTASKVQGGPAIAINTITLNNEGFMLSFSTKTVASNSVNTTTFTYGSNGQILKSIEQDGSSSPTTTTYAYTNGNCTSINDGTTTSTLAYYTNDPYEDGDALRIGEILSYGFPYIKNANLLKSVTTGAQTQNISYTKDSKGRITHVDQTYLTYDYQYECN